MPNRKHSTTSLYDKIKILKHPFQYFRAVLPKLFVHWERLNITSSKHYNDVIMSTMASQIARLAIVYSTVYSGRRSEKHQNSASLAFVRGIHRWPVNFPHKGPVTRKMFPFNDVIMCTQYHLVLLYHPWPSCCNINRGKILYVDRNGISWYIIWPNTNTYVSLLLYDPETHMPHSMHEINTQNIHICRGNEPIYLMRHFYFRY